MKKIFSFILCAIFYLNALANDSYNPSNNQLTIPSIQVGNTTYSNVIITVGSIISVGSSVTNTGTFPIAQAFQSLFSNGLQNTLNVVGSGSLNGDAVGYSGYIGYSFGAATKINATYNGVQELLVPIVMNSSANATNNNGQVQNFSSKNISTYTLTSNYSIVALTIPSSTYFIVGKPVQSYFCTAVSPAVLPQSAIIGQQTSQLAKFNCFKDSSLTIPTGSYLMNYSTSQGENGNLNLQLAGQYIDSYGMTGYNNWITFAISPNANISLSSIWSYENNDGMSIQYKAQ